MKSILFLILFYFFIQLNAQNIQFKFPHFAEMEYAFSLINGEKEDTISKGKMSKDGTLTIQIPEKYRGYKGMGKWSLKNGGGLGIIVNNENFTIECLEPQPKYGNIKYINSEENKFLSESFHNQREILSKYEVITNALMTYSDEDPFYNQLKSEQQKRINEFAEFRKNLNSKNLYASEFKKISDFSAGIGNNLTDDSKTKRNEFNQFIVNEMNWNYLYSSGHWSNLISQWIQINLEVIKDDSNFLKDLKTVTTKLKSDSNIYQSFTNIVITKLTKAEREDILEQL